MNENSKKESFAYIDVANIILSAERIGIQIDFLKLKIYLEDVYRVNKIYYFTANLKFLKDKISILEKTDMSIVLKQVYVENSSTKANCDVEISHYITKHVERNLVSKIILLSGDGDFSILLDYANQNNIKTILMPTDKKSTSKILRVKRFVGITFLKDISSKITNEKAPIST